LVSHVLARRLNAVHVDLAELVKSEKLFKGMDKKRQSLIADFGKISKRVKEICESSSGLVIVDGHYAMNVVPEKDVQRIFVLRRHPEELKKFMEQRGFRDAKLWENLAAEILDVCLFDAISLFEEKKICEIDTTGRSIENVVNEMIAVINGEKTCGVGHVDWLGKLEYEGRLEDFLKDF
jgi:adenylate kinase